MSEYLDKAAAVIEDDIQDHKRPGYTYTSSVRMQHARMFALLAAIDEGLMPEAVAEEIYGQFSRK